MARIRMLVTAIAAGGLALSGLLTAGAASASSPGTTGPGSWFIDQGDGTNAIKTTTTGSSGAQYQAQVQQPINADGSSVFNNKSRTIPVQFTVQKRTCTPGSSTLYPDTLESDLGATYPSIGDHGNLGVVPAGNFTVGDISNLTAHFSWLAGHNAGGSMRWQIDTPDGNVWVYYGDLSTTFQGGIGGSGDNMWASADARFEGSGSFTGSPEYDTMAHVLSRPAPSGTVANEPVTRIALIVDAGWSLTQKVQLQDVTVTIGSETDTYTPGTISGSPTCTAWAQSNADPMWVYLAKTSSATPTQVVDENLVSTQGDSGGQFRQVDSKYIYNMPVSNLPDNTATYQIGISPNSNGSNPIPNTVPFGLK
jgi:hypothetical protein